jgi:carbon monoxide dehydrogenase subunit G
MPTFTETIEVAADPDTAWRVLGDLGGVDRWIPGITRSSWTA